ncbi:MAG: outer membrane protein assembly factor BamA [Candidatus Aminicenantaceae bacterium]
MKRIVLCLILCLMPLLVFGQEVIEKIEITGNQRVTKETIQYYLSSRPGDYYSQDLFRKDFKVLWATGFFADISIEESDGQHGKVVLIIVEENPIIKEITFKAGKKVKEKDIVSRLKEKDAYMLPYSYYSQHKIRRAEEVIKELLVEKGLPASKVEVVANSRNQNEMDVVFEIDEGPKVRVGAITFEGNPKLSYATLMSAFSANKKHGIIPWVTGKDSFKMNAVADDLASLKAKFQEYGYMEATIGEPRFEDMEKTSIFLRKQPMKRIIVPVDAGYRYTVGEVVIEGNQFFTAKYLRSFIKFKEGDVYRSGAREEAQEKIEETYRDWGYIYAQARPIEKLDPKHKQVNLAFQVFEGEVAYLNRLEFKGNTFTKDKVIRREMGMREGDRFSFAMFKDSLLRLNQLGLVELQGDPDIRPNPEDPTQLDVDINLTELQRNNIQFSAGYSGYQGTFVSVSYSTVNFLGAGEKLEAAIQYGKLIKNYSFGFTEPYLFDLPINLGFRVHDQSMTYVGLFNRRSRGVSVNFGGRIRGYVRGSLVYSYENLNVTEYDGSGGDPYYNPYSNPYGSGSSGYYGNPYYSYGKYNISSITPSIYRNTVDSPLTPSSGGLYLAAVKFSGGILGGDVSMIKPRFEISRYFRTIGRQSIGLHAEYSFIKPMDSGVQEVPFWERFFLGGERSIRGYEIYTIGPRDSDGVNVGGAKSLVVNAEYIIPLSGPLYTILFFDAGNAIARFQDFRLDDLYTSAGIEIRIFVPALRVPFRLIFAYNNRLIYRGDSNYNFRFAIGTTF